MAQSSLPIVIASGYGEQTLQARIKSDDRIAFLNKTFSAEQLRAALASLNVTGK